MQPTPLYVMDEIDAALDFKNVSIVANYIKERTKNAQFVIISLRNNMFELADRLIGIYKTHDVTKCVAINPKELVVPCKSNLCGCACTCAYRAISVVVQLLMCQFVVRGARAYAAISVDVHVVGVICR